MTKPAHCSRLAVLLVPALVAGCYTTTNVVTVPPLKTSYPVSASGQYVDAQGTIVKEGEYDVVHSFTFDRRVEVPRHEAGDNTLALEAELDELLAQHQGDAITDVTIAASEYDTGSHGSAASWKVLGWTFGLIGATFAATGLVVDDRDTGVTEIFVTTGLVFMGVGAVSFFASSAADDPAAWQFHVEGNVVKRTAGTAPVPSAVPPLPEPSAPAPSGAPSGPSSPPPAKSPLREGTPLTAPRSFNGAPPSGERLLSPAPGFRPLRVASDG